MQTDYEIFVQVTLRRRGQPQQTARHTEVAEEFDDAIAIFGKYRRALDKVEKDIATERAPHLRAKA